MSNVTIGKPEPGEYPPPFGNYIRLVPEGDIRAILESQLKQADELLDGVSDQDSLAHHAPYTWSIRQVVGHVTDCERVFAYRALRISRDDATPLPGFDQDAWMLKADFDRFPLADLVAEFDLVRRANLRMFEHLEPAAWLRRGVVIGHPASTRAFVHVMAGHAKHHLDIVRKRLAK